MSKPKKGKKKSPAPGNKSKKPTQSLGPNRREGRALEKEADEIELDEEEGKQEFNRENP